MSFRLMVLLSGLAVPVTVHAQSAPQASVAPASGITGQTGLTLAQYQALHERKTMAADTDGDGRVSRAEFLAAVKSGKGNPVKRFAKLDRNGDGYIDKAEVDAMLAHRFNRLDVNANGVLTPQEQAAAKTRKAGAAAKPGTGGADEDS